MCTPANADGWRIPYRLDDRAEVIAAAAESAGLTVLHCEADVERIAGITGQAHEGVVPRGSV
jgi:predicted nucleic acid-binding protein